jgi:hypothetical protein
VYIRVPVGAQLKNVISEFWIIITISELLRMLIEVGQKRPSTLSDFILKHFKHANLYTPRRTTFSHLVNTQVINRLCYIKQHQQNAQFLLWRVRQKTINGFLKLFRDQRDIRVYISLTKSLFMSAGITVSHFFSMLPSTLKYLYSVEPGRMHFSAKQPCKNNTVCSAA